MWNGRSGGVGGGMKKEARVQEAGTTQVLTG